MANCLINQNLLKTSACGYSLRQINEIYLANFDQLSAVTMSTSGDHTVSSVTLTSGSKWVKIQPAKDTASYNDDLVVGGNGSKYRTHTMTFSFNGTYNELVATNLDELSLGKFVAILKLSDGEGVMLGRLTGLEASAASSLSEAAADGQNGITVTLDCNTTETALVVPASVISGLDIVEEG